MLVLHAHLPFVRHPEYEKFLEENWLFEAISETYLPLLRVFRTLREKGLAFNLTLSVSPTLCAMLDDDLLQDRYVYHLDSLIELAAKEMKRTENEPEFNHLSRMYLDLFEENKKDFLNLYGKNILEGFREFQQQGYLELITTAASHAFLPLMEAFPVAIEAQIKTAVDSHIHYFKSPPAGIWLPECGYFPGLEVVLKKYKLEFFFLDTHGIMHGSKKPKYGVYAPISCKNGVAAFGRDPSSSRSVWSPDDGYPTDVVYREYYRDIGYDLPMDYIRPYIHENDLRINTGIKYYAVTGDSETKRIYNRRAALVKVREHAENFVYNREKQIKELSGLMDRPPVVLSPFDAELFGHWWFEGPLWIEALVEELGIKKDVIEMITPTQYLHAYTENQPIVPSLSSWGNNGYAEVWLEKSNDWIYPHLHRAIENMINLSESYGDPDELELRALNQAAREVLLAQTSDWAFIMKTGTTVPYAVKRTREHIYNFNRIYRDLVMKQLDEEWLFKVETKNNIFPWIDYRVFAK